MTILPITLWPAKDETTHPFLRNGMLVLHNPERS